MGGSEQKKSKGEVYVCVIPHPRAQCTDQLRYIKVTLPKEEKQSLQNNRRTNSLPYSYTAPFIMGVSSALLSLHTCSQKRWLSVFIATLLILSASATCVHCTTVEHDLHIVHNVDNRSPEIDPFWYVGRGVRPIGRFGKRQNDTPLHSTLELLLLSALRNMERNQNSDYFPTVTKEVHKSFT